MTRRQRHPIEGDIMLSEIKRNTWTGGQLLGFSGLDRYGFTDLANGIRSKTRSEIERHCERYGTLFEFYDAQRETDPPRLHRKGACAPEKSPYNQVFHDYGWTATLHVDLGSRGV